jgi:hypothetical protein
LSGSASRPARISYISASVEGALSIQSLLTGISGEATGQIAAYEYLCLAYVLADRYTSSEEHRRIQHQYVMDMAEEGARRFASPMGLEASVALDGLGKQIDQSWRSYRRVRSGNRDSSELVREFVSHLTAAHTPLDEGRLAELVQSALLILPLGELIEECANLNWERTSPMSTEVHWPESPNSFADRVTSTRLSKLAPFRDSDPVLENFILNHGPLHRSKVRRLDEAQRQQYYSEMVRELRERIGVWMWDHRRG